MNFVIKDLWYAKRGRHLNFTRKLLMGDSYPESVKC